MSARLDVRRGLLARGWFEAEQGLLLKLSCQVSYNGSDVFVTGPARGGTGRATVNFPSTIPSRVIVAACESWAGAVPGENERPT